MISDAKKIRLNKVTKYFFLAAKFFLAPRTFFLLQEKNLGARKKLFYRFVNKNFLGIRKKKHACAG